MSDLVLDDDFGRIAMPDTRGVSGVYAEVCERDTYRFRKLRDAGLRVDVAIDLGASWGVASRMIRHYWPDARIVAFEPDKSRFKYLETNCPTVECRNVAVAGFVHDRQRLLAGIGADRVKWRLDPADALRSITPIGVQEAFAGIERIDLLKIDVEGFELGIIQEMAECGLLARTRHIEGEWHFKNARLGLIEALRPTHDAEFEMSTPAAQWQPFRATLRGQ